MAIVADWIASGESGSVVGLPGVGRATFLDFLCHRADARQRHLPPHAGPVALVPVDLNNLPDGRLSTLYRVILRSFYEIRERFGPPLPQTIHDLYRRHEDSHDPFLPQSALRELLLLWRTQGTRVVLVLNRFDNFCHAATPQMTATLRGLRDSFKDTLSYIVGMRQEVAYLSHLPALSPLYSLLDTHVCWIGPLSDADARHMLASESAHLPSPLPPADVGRLLALTGGFPSLIRVAGHWRMTSDRSSLAGDWTEALLAQRNMQHRLEEVWQSLTQEEQFVLAEVQKAQPPAGRSANGKEAQAMAALSRQRPAVLAHLAARGICRRDNGRWCITGHLLAAYVTAAAGRSRGKVWLDEATGEVFQGATRLDSLTPLETAVLRQLSQRPRLRLSHSDLIEAAWPEETVKEGVSTEALYQVIRGLRKKIEPDPGEPHYLINWRGQREGGYQFFPEGRPGGNN